MTSTRTLHAGAAQGGAPMLIFRQLFDPQSSTYTYLLGDAARARRC